MDLTDFLRRPAVDRKRWLPWAVTLFAIAWGVAVYDRNFDPEWLSLGWNPGPNVGANFRTYRYAAELASEGASFYGVAPPALEEWAVYLYPPITVVSYLPFTGLDWMTGYRIVVLLNVVAGLAVAAAIVGFLDRVDGRIGWVDVALIAGLLLLSPFTFGTIYYGNINLLIALAFVVGFLWLDGDRATGAGALFGLAALFKLFPAIVGAWLLRRRSWRAVASAAAVGLGGIVAGVLVYGLGPTTTFFTDVVTNRAETAAFVGGFPTGGTYYVTIQRPLSHLIWVPFPDAPAWVLTPLALLVAGGVLAAFYRRVETLQERLTAVFATVVVTVTLFPSLQWYLVLLYFPMVPLWYVWEGPGRRLFLLGGAVMFASASPGELVDRIGDLGLPGPIEFGLLEVVSFATLQTYGIAIMLAACAMAVYGVRPRPALARAGRALRERLGVGS